MVFLEGGFDGGSVAAGDGPVVDVVAAAELVESQAGFVAEFAVRDHVFVGWAFGFFIRSRDVWG